MDCYDLNDRLRALAHELEHDREKAHGYIAAMLYALAGLHGTGGLEELSAATDVIVRRMLDQNDPNRN